MFTLTGLLFLHHSHCTRYRVLTSDTEEKSYAVQEIVETCTITSRAGPRWTRCYPFQACALITSSHQKDVVVRSSTLCTQIPKALVAESPRVRQCRRFFWNKRLFDIRCT